MSRKPPNPRRVRQFQRLVSTFLDANGGVKSVFRNFAHKPTLEQALGMFTAGKFGGSHPFSECNIEFALEYAFDEFNEVFSLIQTNPHWRKETDTPFQHYAFHRAQNEPWANLLFSIFVDKDFAPFVSNLTREEFERFTDREEELIHRETKAIVFDIKFLGVMSPTHDFIANNPKAKFFPSDSKGSYIFHYGIWISSPDLYIETEPEEERPRHDVRAHKRALSSGKAVSVSAHKRRNRLVEIGVPWDGFDDHVVYLAYDIAGELRYIGEGRPDRPAHINSGVSHNFKLNEHYFLKGCMKVEVVAEGLPKPTALAIEKFLITRNVSKGLWNIKDNPLNGHKT